MLRGRARLLVAAGLLIALVGLGAHVARYAFLTDDAFISFRYARNLAHGDGLVFNPGHEAVEGYSNFLWVLILAGLDRLGLAPERAAHPLSLLATLALWGAVVGVALRRPPPPGRAWLVLIPAVMLAATRSFAVWSTSGLETRLFEALVVGGLLRLVHELDAIAAGRTPRALAVWLLALGALTRPDGILFAVTATGAETAFLLARRQWTRERALGQALVYVALIGGHFVFRRLYYGDWLPNTYYAKVGGRLWWGSGARYLGTFALEYAAYLWVPFVAAGVVSHLRGGRAHVPLVYGAAILPHALYVASIGGDHFEYRPLDLYLPLLFLLVYEGACAFAARRRAAWAVAAAIVIVLAGLWWLPDRSHREFPPGYRSGFPGRHVFEARAFLDPDADPLGRLPGLHVIAATHRAWLRRLTTDFVGIRQEEHRMFLATVVAQAGRIRRLIDQELLPRDVYIAMDCVGAIPYLTDMRTLDRLGLTDAHVAHSAFTGTHVLFHDKSATFDYVRERGVDLWIMDPVHTVLPVTAPRILWSVRGARIRGDSVYAAYVGEDEYIVARLPRGLEAAERRMPNLSFQWCGDPAMADAYVDRGLRHYTAVLEAKPNDIEGLRGLGEFLLIARQPAPALRVYEYLSEATPEVPDVWEHKASCLSLLGDPAGAAGAARRAAALARTRDEAGEAARLDTLAEAYARTGPAP